jgi:hypothetical protein
MGAPDAPAGFSGGNRNPFPTYPLLELASCNAGNEIFFYAYGTIGVCLQKSISMTACTERGRGARLRV